MIFATRQFSTSALAAAKRLPSFAGIPSVDMNKYTKDLGEYFAPGTRKSEKGCEMKQGCEMK